MSEDVMAQEIPAVSDLVAVAEELLVRAHKAFAGMERPGYLVPCEPDTTKYRQMVSGMADLCSDLCVPTSGGGSTTYSTFLKIGSGIDYRQRDAIYADFRAEFGRRTGMSINGPGRYTLDRVSTALKCRDGAVWVDFLFGSSWGGIGIRSQISTQSAAT